MVSRHWRRDTNLSDSTITIETSSGYDAVASSLDSAMQLASLALDAANNALQMARDFRIEAEAYAKDAREAANHAETSYQYAKRAHEAIYGVMREREA